MAQRSQKARKSHTETTNEGSADGQADSLPAPPFQRVPDRASSRRRDPLTREAIVAAALKVLDRDGLDRFSMRRVAEELDTGAASLYWHIGSKDGLLDLVFEEVIGEHQIPDPDPDRWQEQIKEAARAMRETIHRHRDIVQLSIGRIPLGPNAIRVSERTLAILRAGGIPDDLAVQSYLLLMSVVNGFTMDERGFEQDEQGTEGPPIDEIGRTVQDYFESLPQDQFPNLREVAGSFAMSDQDARFELLMDLYVEGLARRAGAAA